MNAAHFHLMVNHLPIIFPIAGALVLLVGLIYKSEVVKRTAFLLFAIAAVSAAVAMSSGEGAEEVVEQIAGIEESYIETHEEAAELFAILSYVLGGLSLIGFWASLKQKAFAGTLSLVILLFSLVVVFFGRSTGTTGGEIRHTEIREGAALVPAAGSEAGDDD